MHRVDQVAADAAAVEGVRPLAADLPVGVGEVRVAQDRADDGQLTAGQEELRGRAELREPGLVLPGLLAERGVDDEALVGDLDRRAQVVGQAELAPALERALPGGQHAGDADAEAAGDRGREGVGLTRGRVDEELFVGVARSGLATVDRGHPVRAGVVVDEVATATDTGHVRVGHTERRGDRDRRVRRGSTVAQHVETGLGGLGRVGHDRSAEARGDRVLDRRSASLRGGRSRHQAGDGKRGDRQRGEAAPNLAPNWHADPFRVKTDG